MIRPHAWRMTTLIVLLTTTLVVVAEPVTLNLRNADIQSLISTVSGITGRNFIVDPRVKGKVTVIASKPMDQEEVYQIFLSVLRVHGFAAVPSGSVTKIVPEANAKQDAIPMLNQGLGNERDQSVTLVIPLENVNAAQLVPVLRPLVPPQGHLAAYVPTNVLIVSDRAANVERLQRIVEKVDLVSEAEVEVVRLEHASAGEVVRVLSTLLPRAGSQEQGGRSVQVVADDRTNSIIMSGERAERLRYRTIIAHLDTPLERSGNTTVIYLRYAKATELVSLLQGVSGTLVEAVGEGGQVPANRSKVDIQADETTNALVVTAPPDMLKTLRQVIAKLDIRRAQVLIEAVIADITFERAKQLGVSWILAGGGQTPGAIGIINLGGGIGDALGAISGDGGDDGLGFGDVGIIPKGTTVGVGKLSGGFQFAAIVRALSSDGDTNLLSTPTLVTMDNEEAEIVVGDNVPFVTGQFSNTGANDGATNPFQTIQRQDVGLTLKVKPQINEGDSVRLEISQEVSSLRTAAQSAAVGASDITTTKRSIKTTVMVEDGQVIVLGGLIDDTTRETVEKVPFLGDIPVLGRLFQTRGTELAKRNLMIFIRPVIIRDPKYSRFLTNQKYNYMRDRQLEQQAKGVSMLPNVQRPVLPSADEIVAQDGLTPVYRSPASLAAEADFKITSPQAPIDLRYERKESITEW